MASSADAQLGFSKADYFRFYASLHSFEFGGASQGRDRTGGEDTTSRLQRSSEVQIELLQKIKGIEYNEWKRWVSAAKRRDSLETIRCN
jgi:hypothetical protein